MATVNATASVRTGTAPTVAVNSYTGAPVNNPVTLAPDTVSPTGGIGQHQSTAVLGFELDHVCGRTFSYPQLLSGPTLSWWPVKEDDREFLLLLFKEAHGQELQLLPLAPAQLPALLTMQWKAQQQHYRTLFPHSSHFIIFVSGQKAGHLWLAEQAFELRLVEICTTELLPRSRNRHSITL